MKKIFGGLLVTILMFGFITPVFAVEGAGTSSTDVEYIVEGSFTWSVPVKITVDSVKYPIQVTSFNLDDGKKVRINLLNSENYDNGFYLKKAGDNTLFPYSIGYSFGQGCQAGSEVTVLGFPFLEVGNDDYSTKTSCIDASFYQTNAPTTAGTYTDTLTFQASVVDAD